MFCPVCGSKMVSLAQGFLHPRVDELVRTLPEQAKPTEVLKSNNESKMDYSPVEKELAVSFEACFKCSLLYLSYGKYGIYLDAIGQLNRDFIARMVAAAADQ